MTGGILRVSVGATYRHIGWDEQIIVCMMVSRIACVRRFDALERMSYCSTDDFKFSKVRPLFPG